MKRGIMVILVLTCLLRSVAFIVQKMCLSALNESRVVHVISFYALITCCARAPIECCSVYLKNQKEQQNSSSSCQLGAAFSRWFSPPSALTNPNKMFTVVWLPVFANLSFSTILRSLKSHFRTHGESQFAHFARCLLC